MSPLPMFWFLIVQLDRRLPHDALAFSEGTDAPDAVRNYAEQSQAATNEKTVGVPWEHERAKTLTSYPTTRLRGRSGRR